MCHVMMVISLITTNAYDCVELGYEMPMSEMSFLKLNFPHGKLYWKQTFCHQETKTFIVETPEPTSSFKTLIAQKHTIFYILI